MDSMLYLWLFVAAVCVLVELLTTTFAALCFVCGALLAALLAWLDLSVAWQLVGFSVGSLLGFASLRPCLRRYLYGGKDMPEVATNADALVGRTALVTEAIDPATERGAVKTDGDVWAARSVNGQPIAEGLHVRIVRRDSIVMYVEPVL